MSAPAAATPFASASLYVGDLAPDVTEALLFDTFNNVGPVASVRVCRDSSTRRSLGYAYVNFHRFEDAERALDTMNFKPINKRACRIMWSHRDPSLRKSNVGNVFVKNLAKEIDNRTLYDTFIIFGNILSCTVKCNSKGESLGYGFVHYETDEMAAEAIKKVNGNMIGGKQVNVAQFVPRTERSGTATKYTNLYVKNLPDDATKDSVEEMFAEYGTVTSLALNAKDGKFRGVAFVNMAAPDEAAAAVEGLNGKEFGDKKLFVSRHQKKEERDRELRSRWEVRKAERQQKHQGANLYVKNLTEGMTDAKLNSEFAKFGAITSAKVMFDDKGKSKGFGFVCFTNPEEANKAVSEMSGRILDGKPLYVALAQRKDVRRAALEAYWNRQMNKYYPAPMYPQGAPMFYGPGIPQPGRPMMFPQPHMMPGGGRGFPGGRGGAVMNMPYRLMPAMPAGRAGPGGPGPMRGGGGRGGRGGRGRGGPGAPGGGRGFPPAGPQQGPMGPDGRQQNVRFTGNVRNPQQAAPTPAQAAQASGTALEPLTTALAAATEEQKKQMIGERLFPLVKEINPEQAGKITGMLLEMDNGELIGLLESKKALDDKITEAVAVLSRAEEEEDEEADEEEAEEN